MYDIFSNLAQSYPQLWQLLTGISYLLGVAFIVKSLFMMKHYNDTRTNAMAQQGTFKAPLVTMIIGAALLFWPSTLATLMQTGFGYDQAQDIAYMSYIPGVDSTSLQAVLGFIQIVGFIAFIRGWVELMNHHSHQQGGGQGSGKAWTHIIGGILAVNIVGTQELIWNTFGFG